MCFMFSIQIFPFQSVENVCVCFFFLFFGKSLFIECVLFIVTKKKCYSFQRTIMIIIIRYMRSKGTWPGVAEAPFDPCPFNQTSRKEWCILFIFRFAVVDAGPGNERKKKKKTNKKKEKICNVMWES